MNKSKLFVLFQSFNPKERLALRKFLQSPYRNKRKDVLKLYQYLEMEGRKKSPDWSKMTVFKAIYPDQDYNEIQMRHLMSVTFRLMEDFLAVHEEEDKAIRQKISLARSYRKRQLYKFFEQTLKAAETLLEKMPKDHQYFHFKYLLELESYQFIKSRKRIAEYNLQELSNAVDIRFLTNKLKQNCLLLSHQAVYNIDYDQGLLPMVLEALENSPYLKLPAISIYYHCYLALTSDLDTNFRAFKEQLLESGQEFSEDEQRDLYLLAINFCIKKLNTGRENYVKEAFSFYRNGLEKGILIEKKRLSRFAFKNVVALGLNLKEYDWIAYFLEHYQQYLERAFRANYYNYNYARLAYSTGQYKAAMEALVKVGSNDLLLNIDAKVLLLKMYVELEEYEPLEALLSSMRTLIRRKSMLAYHRENYFNIIKYFQKLVAVNFNDREAKVALAALIEGESVLTEKKWLLERLQ